MSKKKQPPAVKPEDITTVKRSGKRTSIEVSAHQLRPAPWNPRPEISPESVADLAASIRELGLIQRIVVIKDPDKKPVRGVEFYMIVAGHRRFAAWNAANIEGKIPCELLECTIEEAKRMTMIENLQRKDVDPIMEADLIEGLVKDGMTIEAIAAETGRGEKWVWRRKQLVNLSPAWRKEIEENSVQFTVDCLEKISRYSQEVQESVRKDYGWLGRTRAYDWSDFAHLFKSISRNLSEARFCTGDCETCVKNSAHQPMLFDDPTDKKGRILGRCMDKECYERKAKEAFDKEREKLEKKYGKLKTFGNSWSVPGCATQKKTKDNTVPYIVSSMRDGSGGGIMWGRPEPKKSEAKRQDAKAEKLRKKIERSACAKISEWCDNNLKDAIAAILGDEGTRVVNARFLAEHLYRRIDIYLGGYGALEEASIVYMTFMRGEESSREDAYRLTEDEEKVVKTKWEEVFRESDTAEDTSEDKLLKEAEDL